MEEEELPEDSVVKSSLKKKASMSSLYLSEQLIQALTFEELCESFANRGDLDIISHSLFASIDFSGFESYQCMAYNMLGLFMFNKPIKLNKSSEFMMY